MTIRPSSNIPSMVSAAAVIFSGLSITDIMINGPKVAYIERKGRLERVNVPFNDERHLLQIVQRIANLSQFQ